MFRVVLNRVGTRALSSTATLTARHGLKPLQLAVKPSTVLPSCSGMMKSLNVIQAMQIHSVQTKGDEELVTFLNEEIATEKKSSQPLPKRLDDFEVKFEESILTFTKKFNDESIVITLNVNHTVDAEPVQEGTQAAGAEEGGDMKSKPHFDVDIVKGSQTLTFSCSYAVDDVEQTNEGQEDYNDLFVIDEVSLYDGEPKDSSYAVAGEILDGYLYDLFMNMLEERGVTNEFADKLSAYATNYEHSLYVQLLSKLQSFVKSK